MCGIVCVFGQASWALFYRLHCAWPGGLFFWHNGIKKVCSGQWYCEMVEESDHDLDFVTKNKQNKLLVCRMIYFKWGRYWNKQEWKWRWGWCTACNRWLATVSKSDGDLARFPCSVSQQGFLLPLSAKPKSELEYLQLFSLMISQKTMCVPQTSTLLRRFRRPCLYQNFLCGKCGLMGH